MSTLPDFRLETHFSKWEFKARYHLTASDAQSMSLQELLAYATTEERAEFENMWLGYTETFGAPDVRDEIANTFTSCKSDDILCFAGASEGIFAANSSLPLSICETSGVPLDPSDKWSLDIDRVAESIKPNTRLITINFPHNPTGAILPLDRFHALVDLCSKHGIYILHDEIFNGLGETGTEHLPFVADIYERGLSLNVMSKAYGLPGLRVGWIACKDKNIIDSMEKLKHYLSICNSGPSERLTKIALRYRQQLLARTCAIVDENLPKWDAFFNRHTELFDWQRPDGSLFQTTYRKKRCSTIAWLNLSI